MSRWRMYNPNPAGRAVGDCSVRAVAAALGISWEDAYSRIAKAGFQMADMPSSNGVLMDEMMDTIQAIHPRLYKAVMERLR